LGRQVADIRKSISHKLIAILLNFVTHPGRNPATPVGAAAAPAYAALAAAAP